MSDEVKLNVPQESEWHCVLLGEGHADGVVYRPLKGSEPNAFHRMMHRLAFGFKWIKDEKGS